MPRKRVSKNKKVALPVLNPDAAGIDIGATEIYVAVSADRDPEPVRMFATFTQDLNELADWLQQCSVHTVAMESTGVYWIPLMQILEIRGLEVYLVNAKHVKNVPGRRTDVSDCQWLQYLHSVGWLRASFRPAQDICAVRSLLRHRTSLVDMATRHVQHMHHVISDITGTTGLAILDAILDGNRDAHALAALRDPRIRASHETIAKSLVGDHRREHLFTLRQSVALYREYQRQIAACEREMQVLMKSLETKANPTATLPAAKDSVKKCKVMPPARAMALREEAYRYSRRGSHDNSGNQCPACTVHTRRVRWRRLKIPKRRSIQFVDGALPGQRHQRWQSALERDQKGQEPHRRHAPNGGTVTSTERIRSGSFLSPDAIQTRRPESHHRCSP